ncbi:MAG: DUF2470 domain-containing protein [Alphaproteobacteria bacterium]
MLNETVPYPDRVARELIRAAATATLATLQSDAGGWPYGSLVQLATDARGRPILLLSDLAEHTRNLAADDRVSLLLDGTGGLDEPLTGARLSLQGRIAPSAEPADRARYLRRFPGAALFADFKDFRFYRIEPVRGHLVAGFGRIHWIDAEKLVLESAMAEAAAALEVGVLDHMNADHADAVAPMAERIAGLPGQGAVLCGFDAEGCDVRVGARVGRIPFPAPVADAAAARATLAALARQARGNP